MYASRVVPFFHADDARVFVHRRRPIVVASEGPPGPRASSRGTKPLRGGSTDLRTPRRQGQCPRFAVAQPVSYGNGRDADLAAGPTLPR